MGAAWVHQSCPENLFKALTESTPGTRVVYQEALYRAKLFDEETRAWIPEHVNAAAEKVAKSLVDGVGQVSAAVFECPGAKDGAVDLSVEEAFAPLKRAAIAAASTSAEVEPRTFARAVDWWLHDTEQFMGMEFDKLSALHWDDTDHLKRLEGPDEYVASGAGRCVQQLARGLDVRLGAKVTAIITCEATVPRVHSPSGRGSVDGGDGLVVEVVCEDGRRFRARRVVVTIPLGVLKANLVRFDPPLRPEKQRAIRNLGVGIMNKVVLTYPTRFWSREDLVLGYCGKRSRGYFPWFLSLEEATGSPTLVCFIVGEAARKEEGEGKKRQGQVQRQEHQHHLQHQQHKRGVASQVADHGLARAGDDDDDDDDAGTVARCHQVLVEMFGPSIPAPAWSLVTRWATDPHTLGSWTVYKVGSCAQDAVEMARPDWGGKLLFAGEHCSPEEQGCVHGALKTGVEAARELLEGSGGSGLEGQRWARL